MTNAERKKPKRDHAENAKREANHNLIVLVYDFDILYSIYFYKNNININIYNYLYFTIYYHIVVILYLIFLKQ
jgi:hypothetical protein